MPDVTKGRWYPDMPPALPGEDDAAYTDRLTGADGMNRRPYDHHRNRQCSIGWHNECSDPAGEDCKCPCHQERPVHPMLQDLSDITPEMARHVLYHFGEEGHRAGSFTTALIELIARADPANKAKLALAFPDYVRTVVLAQETLGGVNTLKKIARGDLDG